MNLKPETLDEIQAARTPEPPTCCGVPCPTAYCPHCSKKLREPSDALSLMAYLKRRTAGAVKKGNGAAVTQFGKWHEIAEKAWEAEIAAAGEAT